jgi:hypothetical protein
MPVFAVILSSLLLFLSACQISPRPEAPAQINLPADAIIYRAIDEGQ